MEENPQMSQKEVYDPNEALNLIKDEHALLLEMRNILRRTQIVATIRLGIMIFFVVIPFIATLIFLPTFLTNYFNAVTNNDINVSGLLQNLGNINTLNNLNR